MNDTRREFLFMLLVGAIIGMLATAVVHDYWVGANAFHQPTGPWKQPV